MPLERRGGERRRKHDFLSFPQEPRASHGPGERRDDEHAGRVMRRQLPSRPTLPRPAFVSRAEGESRPYLRRSKPSLPDDRRSLASASLHR